jgi:hypothetical protein
MTLVKSLHCTVLFFPQKFYSRVRYGTSTWQPQEVELAADLGVGPTGVRNIIAERVTTSTLWLLQFSLSRNHEADPNFRKPEN